MLRQLIYLSNQQIANLQPLVLHDYKHQMRFLQPISQYLEAIRQFLQQNGHRQINNHLMRLQKHYLNQHPKMLVLTNQN